MSTNAPTAAYIITNMISNFLKKKKVLLYSRHLPREVDPLVYNMSIEDPGDVSYNQIGGLGEQIRELREV